MNHQQAIQAGACERYLLDEMGAEERDLFEAHYFDCPICAADLKATQAFLTAARTDLRRPPVTPRQQSWWQSLIRPSLLGPACATLLLVLVAENLYLGVRPAGAPPARGPELLPALTLVGGDTRSAVRNTIRLKGAQSFLMGVDVPSDARYTGYQGTLLSQDGSALWHVDIARQSVDDTLWFRVPAAAGMAGDFTLLIEGLERADQRVKLAHYRFTIEP